MKTCHKCKVEKPEGSFYKRSNSPDGLDAWCKVCRNADSKERYETGNRQLPWSTDRAIRLLSENGIPTTVGRIVGRPGKDIVAYGYITIEAKSAQPHGINGYIFGMTKAQRQKPCDYYLLICKDTGRVFVVPGDSEVLNFGATALIVNVTNPRLLCFENAYQTIKDRVVLDIHRSEPIRAVRVLSGDRYYNVIEDLNRNYHQHGLFIISK